MGLIPIKKKAGLGSDLGGARCQRGRKTGQGVEGRPGCDLSSHLVRAREVVLAHDPGKVLDKTVQVKGEKALFETMPQGMAL